MTNEEAKKMLKAKLECLKNETSGINYDCNMRLCDGCSLNYEQGNMGEQKEALEMAIKALEQQPKTGHWEQYGDSWEDKFKCSECGKEQPKILCGERIIGHWSDYCPNCGARMESEVEE